eukprot:scaffold90879_cov63-Phaeocystis_antarctica.AAC.2
MDGAWQADVLVVRPALEALALGESGEGDNEELHDDQARELRTKTPWATQTCALFWNGVQTKKATSARGDGTPKSTASFSHMTLILTLLVVK